MIEGLMKRTGVLAFAATASLLAGGWHMSAKAADLGGDCCADLEERVAELEATTVRKGNRKVSLELSGQVNKALMGWDDGIDSDVYIVDNYQTTSRMRLKGSGQMLPGVKAGFYVEYEMRDSNSSSVNQFDSVVKSLEGGPDVVTGSPLTIAMRMRQENVWIESEKFGRVTVGLQNPASKDITFINLGGSIGSDPENDFMSNFWIRDNTLRANVVSSNTFAVIPNSSFVKFGNVFNAMETTRVEAIRYDTPSLFGFVASTSFAANDFWSAALRYQKEWNSIRIAGGIAYSYIAGRLTDNVINDGGRNAELMTAGFLPNTPGQYFSKCINPAPANASFGTPYNECIGTKSEVVAGSLSVMHVPTGIYATFAGGTRSVTNMPTEFIYDNFDNKDAAYFYIQLGITKRFLDVGSTTLYAEFGNYQDYAVGDNYGATLWQDPGTVNIVTNSEVNRWGLGFVQMFDSSALQLYAMYQHYSTDITTRTPVLAPIGPILVDPVARSPDDADVVVSGARLQF
ncbi:MAG: porin [Rhodomicrobium sp.]|nr:porin [Rhodomicrobium sp.]